jgi:hypothetical protein
MNVDSSRDAGEHHERQHERPAAEDVGASRGKCQAEDRGGAEQRPVPVRREVDREQDRAESPRAEAHQPLDARRRDEQQREPEAADDAAGVSRHGVTTTTAFATWPRSATRRT